MTCDDSAFDGSDSDDFQRWYFGGSPPESDAWEAHGFEEALHSPASFGEPFDREAPDRDNAAHGGAFAPIG